MGIQSVNTIISPSNVYSTSKLMTQPTVSALTANRARHMRLARRAW